MFIFGFLVFFLDVVTGPKFGVALVRIGGRGVLLKMEMGTHYKWRRDRDAKGIEKQGAGEGNGKGNTPPQPTRNVRYLPLLAFQQYCT